MAVSRSFFSRSKSAPIEALLTPHPQHARRACVFTHHRTHNFHEYHAALQRVNFSGKSYRGVDTSVFAEYRSVLAGEGFLPRAIVLHASDNVATLIDGTKSGDSCALQGEATHKVIVEAEIPFGHKICIKDIPAGSTILKYGQVIGKATTSIRVGEHVHDHNVESTRARGDQAQLQ